MVGTADNGHGLCQPVHGVVHVRIQQGLGGGVVNCDRAGVWQQIGPGHSGYHCIKLITPSRSGKPMTISGPV